MYKRIETTSIAGPIIVLIEIVALALLLLAGDADAIPDLLLLPAILLEPAIFLTIVFGIPAFLVLTNRKFRAYAYALLPWLAGLVCIPLEFMRSSRTMDIVDQTGGEGYLYSDSQYSLIGLAITFVTITLIAKFGKFKHQTNTSKSTKNPK